jgi:thiamine kinase-like enzyme
VNPQIKAIEAIPHSITLGECLKDGPVTQVFHCVFEGIKAVIRLDLPISQTLGLDRYSEIELLKFLEGSTFTPKILFAAPENGVLIWQYIPGVTLDDTTTKPREITSSMGSLLGDLHQLNAPVSLPVFSSFINRYRDLLSAEMNHSIILKGFSLFDLISKSQAPMVLSHNDINPGNLLIGKKLFIMDWEYASLNHPYFDLASSIENLALNNEQIKEFIQSYETSGFAVEHEELALWREFSLYLSFFWLMIIEKYATISEKEKAWMVNLENRLSQAKG